MSLEVITDFTNNPESATTISASRAAEKNETASHRFWGLDWRRELPWSIDGISVEVGTFDDAIPFMEEHYPSIFGGSVGDRFFVEEMTEAKRRFCDEMDTFVFRSAGRAIGICTAHPTDWSTYYIRTFAILPEFRERRFATGFEDRLCEPLRAAGVNRYEADCSIANQPMIRLFIHQGFMPTATISSERWGSILRFTKHLDAGAKTVFGRQFVNVPLFGKSPGSAESTK